MSQNYCGKCGKPLDIEWISCPYCGRVIGAQASPSQQIQPVWINDIKKLLQEYIWIFPLIGGVLIILALLSPVAYFEGAFFGLPVKWYFWMWGFGYGINGFGVVNDGVFLIFSLGISLLFSISSLKLIHLAYTVKTYEDVYDSLNKLLYAIGIFQLILLIGWIIVFEIFYTGIWAIAEVGFGIIGIFISAFITIIAGVLKKKN